MIFVFFILGLIFGSFVNAAVWRLHQQLKAEDKEGAGRTFSILRGRSVCPKCGRTLRWYELVPLVSWAIQKGKCRRCGGGISLQYPLVELTTGGLFTVSFAVLPHTQPFELVNLALWLAVVTGLVVLAVYDLRFQLLPDKVMAPLLGVVVLWLVLQAVFQGDITLLLPRLLAAGLAGGFFYSLFGWSGGRWMGGGDVKLAFVLGLILGPALTLVGLLLAFNAAALVSLVLIGLGKANRKSRIPFGPFLIAGGIFAMLFGTEVITWYFQLVGIY